MEDKSLKSKDYLLQVFIPVAKEEAEGMSDVINCLDSIDHYLKSDTKSQILELVDEMSKRKIPDNPNSAFLRGYKKALTELKQKIEQL